MLLYVTGVCYRCQQGPRRYPIRGSPRSGVRRTPGSGPSAGERVGGAGCRVLPGRPGLAGEPAAAGDGRTARTLAAYRRGIESEEVRSRSRPPRRRDRRARPQGRGYRRREVSALRWADVDDAGDVHGGAGHRPLREDEAGGRDEGTSGSVKRGISRAIRTLRPAASPAPENRVVPLRWLGCGSQASAGAVGVEHVMLAWRVVGPGVQSPRLRSSRRSRNLWDWYPSVESDTQSGRTNVPAMLWFPAVHPGGSFRQARSSARQTQRWSWPTWVRARPCFRRRHRSTRNRVRGRWTSSRCAGW